MQEKFQQYNCKPATKLYYGHYHTSIAFRPIRESVGRPNIPDRFNNTYRTVSTPKAGFLVTKIYTSNEELLDYILDDIFLSINISEVFSPVNESHLRAIQDKDVDTMFRENYWYSQYQYKVSVTPKRDVTIPDEEELELQKILNEDYQDCRIIQSYQPWVSFSRSSLWGLGYTPPQTMKRQWYPPTIFTNSEENIFLLKMRFNHLYRFQIIKIILLEDILKG